MGLALCSGVRQQYPEVFQDSNTLNLQAEMEQGMV
jgi:hypothetical protein